MVRVLGTACGLGIEGSGWVAAPGADRHQRPRRRRRGRHHGRPRATAPRSTPTPVHYDPANDLALLRVGAAAAGAAAGARHRPRRSRRRGPRLSRERPLRGRPRPLRRNPRRDQRGLLRARPGRGARSASLRGTVRSGNSGGPLVDAQGRVLGTVFATTTYGTPAASRSPTPSSPKPCRAPTLRSTRSLHRRDRLTALHFRSVNSLPPEVERRRRLVTRTLPLAVDRARRLRLRRRRRAPPARPRRKPPSRFAAAWASGELRRHVQGAEPGLAGARSSSTTSSSPTAKPSRSATLRSLEARLRPATPPRATATTVVPVADRPSRTVAFGRFEDELELPYADGGIAWDPSLVFPGLRSGEHLESRDRTGAAGADPRRRRHAAGRRPGRRTRTPARQRRDRRHRRSRRPPKKKTCRRSPARASPPTPRSGSAASSRPSTPASPASPAARCWRSREDGGSARDRSPRPSRSRGRR